MKLNCDQVFQKLWQQYVGLNPDALKIHQLLTGNDPNKKLLNDHVAFRTFKHPKFGIDHLASNFKNLGYQEKGEYHFEVKKLYAKHFEHTDKSLPKVFISELLIENFSNEFQNTFLEIARAVNDETLSKPEISYAGPLWPKSYKVYQNLYQESPYGAWLYAFGFCANHFTVFFNDLNQFSSLQELNIFLKNNNFTLNASGGEIKGSPEDYLEQSSTMAAEIVVDFNDGSFKIPSCYYEFARRYPEPPSMQLYQGFVAKSADKIFESTNKNR